MSKLRTVGLKIKLNAETKMDEKKADQINKNGSSNCFINSNNIYKIFMFIRLCFNIQNRDEEQEKENEKERMSNEAQTW